MEHLLTSPGSPLHLYGREADLSETLTAIHREAGGPLMFDVAAIAIGVACFAFAFGCSAAGARLMSAADVFGLVVAIAVFVYLTYALFRGEKL